MEEEVTGAEILRPDALPVLKDIQWNSSFLQPPLDS